MKHRTRFHKDAPAVWCSYTNRFVGYVSLRRSSLTDMTIVHNKTQNLVKIFALWPLSQIWFCAMGHCGYLVKHYGPLQPIICLLWATAPNFSPCYWPTMPNLVRIRRYGGEGGGVIELNLISCCEIFLPPYRFAPEFKKHLAILCPRVFGLRF
jgi:hypothetical protein